MTDQPAVGPLGAEDEDRVETLGPAAAFAADVVRGEAFMPGEVTDEWAERFCEAVNWSPDGEECKSVEGQMRCVSFRDLAKGYILSAIATQPDTGGAVEASGVERDYTDAEILRDTVPADLRDGEIVAFGLRMEGAAGLYPSIRNTEEGASKLAARLAEESPENPPYVPVALSLRPQPSGETLQSLAQAFEDAMEGSHGAWAVSGDEGPLSATTVADKIQADTDAKLTDCPSGETREAVLKGVGKINGDGWKDTTTEGEIVFVWNAEKPAPYAPGQYPRVGNEGWSASTSQYDFTPATADDVPAIIALLSARPAPVASSDQPEQGALEVVAWPVVTDQWTETYCELTGRDPDGKQVTFVDGATVTTFRDMAKREIEAMLCAAPKAAVRAIAALTPPAEPVSRPAGEGEREAVARIIKERVSGPHFTDPALNEAMDRDRLTAADAILSRNGKGEG